MTYFHVNLDDKDEEFSRFIAEHKKVFVDSAEFYWMRFAVLLRKWKKFVDAVYFTVQ